MERFDGRVALVTGGGSGIGRETALSFAREGADVVVADIDDPAGTETAETIERAGGEATFVGADVTNPAAVRAMVDTTVERYGRLDVAFNNAGVAGPDCRVADHTEDEWERVIGVNLDGVWRCCKHELEQFCSQDGGGVIVNTASVLGKAAQQGLAAYAAAKHGVIGLTRTAALEYAGADVRVNAVCPGYVSTPMVADDYPPGSPECAEIERLHPMGRFADADEIAWTVLWLCSEDASFVTGSAVDVDGGYLSR